MGHLIYICITMMISLGITLLFCMGTSLATFDDGPKPKGPPIRRHQNIQVDIEQEREHIKDQVKEAYLDTATMDDGQLLMQFFKKRDSDNNMKLDGLELLTALVEMEEDGNHHHGEHAENTEEFINREDYASIVDNILEDDDIDKDGYINWPEFKRRQKQQG